MVEGGGEVVSEALDIADDEKDCVASGEEWSDGGDCLAEAFEFVGLEDYYLADGSAVASQGGDPSV